MTLRDKIEKSIDEKKACASRVQREPYEDNYDGFTHYTYEGLADQVEEELDGETSMSAIDELVDALF